MLKEEFERLIGIKVSPEHYAEVEAIYMAIPDDISISKENFARCYAGSAASLITGLMSWLYRQLNEARLDAKHYKAVFHIACEDQTKALNKVSELRAILLN